MSGVTRTELQAIIDRVSGLGGGDIYLPQRGETDLGGGVLTVKAGVNLIGNQGFSFTSTSNQNMVKLAYQGHIEGRGLTITNTNASFSSALLMVEEGNGIGDFRFRVNTTGASDVRLVGHSQFATTGSKGLYLYAEAGTGYTNTSIESCYFHNLMFQNLDNCLYEEARGETGAVLAFCNGNRYNGLTAVDCTHGLVSSVSGAGTVAVNSNQYYGINFQAGAGTQTAIDTIGDNNQYQGRIFDWDDAAGANSIVSSHAGNPNIFMFPALGATISIEATDKNIFA